MSCAFIALGSNLAKPQEQLQQAVTAINRLPGCKVIKTSSTYLSAAVGPGQQPDYLNAALQLETQLAPLELLSALQMIETSRAGSGNYAGERAPLIWTSCFMTNKAWITPDSAFPIRA